jgi:hypothetical protein
MNPKFHLTPLVLEQVKDINKKEKENNKKENKTTSKRCWKS